MDERVRWEGKLRWLAKVEVALDERVGDAGVGSGEPGLLQQSLKMLLMYRHVRW